MERLLKDAQAITGVKYDISNLADVYTAIHVIQEQLGITGTTAKEAEKTISGSAKAMKASWENLVSSVAGGGDIDKAIDNFARSVAVYFENIVPVVERALQGVGYLIERLAPLLVQRLSATLIRSIPQLLSAVYQMIIGLAKGVYEGITALFKGTATETIKEQSEAIAESVKNQQQLTEAVEDTEEAQKGSLASFDQINTLSKETAEMEELPAFSVGEMLPITEEIEPIEIEVKVKNTTKAEQEIRKMFSSIGQLVQPIKDSLVGLFAPMVDDVQYIWDEILTPFSDWIIDTFAPAFASNLANSIDTVTESNETLRDSIKSFWEEDLKPIVEDIGVIIEAIMAKTDEALQYFQDKMAEHKDSLASVIDGIGAIIGLLWKLIKPLFEFLVNQTFDSFKNVTDGIFAIIEYFGNLFNVIKNIVGGIVALCKGNFEEAGEYFKNAGKAFVNIWIGILNLIISGINELWSWIFNSFKSGVNAIGGVIEKVGGYLGADWDLHWDAQAPLIPDIPYLAKGAVLPANKPFLAMLGDQKHGTNIEAPLDTIKQALAEVLAQVNVNNGDVPPIIINVDIDGKNLLTIMRSAEDRYGNQIITGGFANA